MPISIAPCPLIFSRLVYCSPLRHSHGGTNCMAHMPFLASLAASSCGTYFSEKSRNASAHPAPTIIALRSLPPTKHTAIKRPYLSLELPLHSTVPPLTCSRRNAAAAQASTPLHDFAHHTTVFRGHPARRPACRDAQSIANAGQRPRGPRGRPPHTVAGGTPPGGPPGRRERLPTRPPQQRRCRCGGWMGPHRPRVPSCRGNGKSDRMGAI